MRYPDGGGLTPAARARRELVRLEAAGLFAAGVRPPQAAKQLRVSRKSAYAWHKAWSLAGTEAFGCPLATWAKTWFRPRLRLCPASVRFGAALPGADADGDRGVTGSG
jgi:Homeodomain-like domain